MQIYSAAERALLDIGKPAHLREIHAQIVQQSYFAFGAANPLRALGVAIDRHAKGVQISRPASPILFFRARPATYGLLSWLDAETNNDLALDEEVTEAAQIEELDAALFLEQELHRWLFKNWEQSRLTILEHGPLELVDPEQQLKKMGKYNTKAVGEIDMLFRTASGDYLVCELKRQSDDQTIGQLCRYWGWVKENLAKERLVHGLVLAQEVSSGLRYAVKATAENISFRELTLDIKLGPNTR
ncbi:MAG: endonuclease NucS domain-containing protein [Burkholderiales bacterium]